MSTGASQGGQVRSAELVAALCLASDLGMGFPFEHGLHSTLIAMRLADRLGVDGENVSQTYYACLLSHSGCTTDTNVTRRSSAIRLLLVSTPSGTGQDGKS